MGNWYIIYAVQRPVIVKYWHECACAVEACAIGETIRAAGRWEIGITNGNAVGDNLLRTCNSVQYG